jgi:hypothetical protein
MAISAKHGINKGQRVRIMSEQAEALLPEIPTEYDDPEDLLDALVNDYADIPVAQDYFPEEYVVYYTGPRGSSKTLQLARHSLMALASGTKVFTNLELYPEKAGVTNKPNPVNLEFLLSFDESLEDAVITISEIDTWFDRMRETSTGNRLGGKFLQQLRKKGLRIFFDTQDYLPGVLMRQVDKLVYCNDFFFSQWGKERNLPKGTTFYYDCYDYSGIFTGWRGYHWREVLYHAERVWPLFNTNKIHDPREFGRRFKIVGGEMEYNRDTGQFYAVGEKAQQMSEAELNESRLTATKLMREWEGSGFLQGLIDHEAITDGPDNEWLAISTKAVKKYLANLTGEARKIAEEQSEELRLYALTGRVAAFGPEGSFIAIRRPFVTETPNEQ